MKFEKKTFSNGLRAIVAPMKDTQAITLWVLFGTGSKYETKKLNGTSHFLEHLFFKGTKSRPEAGQVNRELDRLGAESNAFTSKEYTGYYVKAAAKHFDTALDIVSDILIKPLFKKVEKALAQRGGGKKLSKPQVRDAQKLPAVKFKKKDVDQTHIRLGVRAYDMYDERRYALAVLNTILGGNWSSRLFMELREKLGLAYYVRSFVDEYMATGYVMAAAGVPHRTLPQVAKKIIEVFKDAKKKISPSEIK